MNLRQVLACSSVYLWSQSLVQCKGEELLKSQLVSTQVILNMTAADLTFQELKVVMRTRRSAAVYACNGTL